jgi:hypothetical protein
VSTLANIRTYEELWAPNLVYIDRRSKWGNPFRIGKDGNRAEVIEKYRAWITKGSGSYLLKSLHELRGKVLMCWCWPLPCHGNVLLELLIERWPEERQAA